MQGDQLTSHEAEYAYPDLHFPRYGETDTGGIPGRVVGQEFYGEFVRNIPGRRTSLCRETDEINNGQTVIFTPYPGAQYVPGTLAGPPFQVGLPAPPAKDNLPPRPGAGVAGKPGRTTR